MARALFLLLSSLLLAGCITRKSEPAPRSGAENTGADTTLTPSPFLVVGRIIAVDVRNLSVIVELAPYAEIPADLDGRSLIARTDDLQPTARLLASPYLRGRMLGTRLIAGNPQKGDEVVLPP